MSRNLFIFISVSVFIVLFGTMVSGDENTIETLDFDGLNAGAEYDINETIDVSNAAINVLNTLVHTSPADPNGDPNNYVIVSDDCFAGGAGNELHVLNVMLDFDFKSSVESIAFRYFTEHKNLNIFVNNELVSFSSFSQIDQVTIGGCHAAVYPDGSRGTVTLTGIIYSFAMGGENIFIDDVEYTPSEPVSYHIDIAGDDNNTGLSKGAAFATIQKGIDIARHGDIILVHPGIYTESISFNGKKVTVRNASEPPILESPSSIAVRFDSGETYKSVIRNFIIRNSEIAISCVYSSPTIRNVTVVNNNFGIVSYAGAVPNISNSIFWANTYGDTSNSSVRFSCTQTLQPGPGNISVDPLFVKEPYWDFNGSPDPNDHIWIEGDYRLKSSGWRYSKYHLHGSNWTYDTVTSRCIDAGDPSFDLEDEPVTLMIDPDNTWGVNKRINIGAYGGTQQASIAPENFVLLSDISNDGIVNYKDFIYLSKNWMTEKSSPGDFDRNAITDPCDLSVFAGQWQYTTSWFAFVDMPQYWPISEGLCWRSLPGDGESFVFDVNDVTTVNQTIVWTMSNDYTNSSGITHEHRYYFYTESGLYSTTDANDLDLLYERPVAIEEFRKEFPRTIYGGSQIDHLFYGTVYVMQGSLSEVLMNTELSLEDFPAGDMPDVVALIANYGRPSQKIAAIFAKNLGPLMMASEFTSSLIIDR